ncbi:MAG: hypothetical protein AAF922_07100 [Pseudomonadota bacterium]
MDFWSLRDAKLEFERIIAMSEQEFRAEILSAGEDPDQVIEQFDAAMLAAIARARAADEM